MAKTIRARYRRNGARCFRPDVCADLLGIAYMFYRAFVLYPGTNPFCLHAVSITDCKQRVTLNNPSPAKVARLQRDCDREAKETNREYSAGRPSRGDVRRRGNP